MDDPYREPVLYDLEYADHTEDIDYYVRMARSCGGSVLELACGNGRITVPIARAGVQVTGIDLSQPMIDDLHDKLWREPTEVRKRVRLAQRDFRTLEADGEQGLGRHPLVMLPFNALHHCMSLDDVRQVLDGVRDCLQERGLFALDCFLPDASLYDRDPSERHEPRDFIDPRTGGRLTSWERSWYEEDDAIHNVVYSYLHADGRQEDVHLRLRIFQQTELRATLQDAGFELLQESAGFDGRPMRPDSLKWVMLWRLRDA